MMPGKLSLPVMPVGIPGKCNTALTKTLVRLNRRSHHLPVFTIVNRRIQRDRKNSVTISIVSNINEVRRPRVHFVNNNLNSKIIKSKLFPILLYYYTLAINNQS